MRATDTSANRQVRAIVFDSALIGSVAVLLAGIHFLAPPATQARLAFNYQQFDPLNLLTAAYVHHSEQHLAGNVTAFLAAATVANILCQMSDERRWFHLTFGVFLVILPVLVSLTSYAVITYIAPGVIPTSRGFSGVAAGFAGFVLAALAVLVAKTYSRSTGLFLGQAIFLGLLCEVGLIYAGVVRLELVVLAIAGLVLNGWGLVREGTWPDSREQWVNRGWDAVFVGLVVVLLGVFVFGLFPAQIATGDSTTNIIAHGIGFLYGIAIAVACRVVQESV